jgi:RNA polymerase sigma-70 factor (ECF subfamily)
METDQIVQGCRKGGKAAMEALVQAYERSLYRLALSLLDDPAEAEETVQDAFLAALKAIHTYREEAALGTWLYRITTNLCRSRLRRRMARERLKQALQAVFRLADQDRTGHPESAAIQNEANTEVWRAVQSLNETHRLVVILFYFHDRTVADIAQILGIPAGTVYSRLETAYGRLRGLLKFQESPRSPQGSPVPGPGSKNDPALPNKVVPIDRKFPDG